MSSEASLWFAVIYRHPLDYPGKYVVRGQVARPGGVVADPEPVGVVDTLEEARALIPEGLVCLARSPEDQPQIVESWV